MKKRLLSILLCLAMVAGVFPATAFAATPAKTAHVFEEASKSRRPKRVAGKDKFIDSKTFIASTIDQRTAVVNDVTITGTVGHVLTKQTFDITLTDDAFNSSEMGIDQDVRSWFDGWGNNGIVATMQKWSKDGQELTIALSGTSMQEMVSEIRLTIPSQYLASGKPLKVTPNPNARFVIKLEQAPPSGLTAEMPTSATGNGKIKGTTSLMEYSIVADADIWEACTNMETEVSPGTYYVRCKEGAHHNPSPTVEVTVPDYVAPFEPSAAMTDVTITGTVDAAMMKHVLVLTLKDEAFRASGMEVGQSVRSWFDGWEKNGMNATIDQWSPHGQELTIAISGTPVQEMTGEIRITIPGKYLASGEELKVTPNPNAVYLVQLPIQYDVSVLNDGNGTASANPVKAPAGTEITLAATPKSGYKLKEWQVMLSDVTIGADNKFIMPNGDVELKAIFEANLSATVADVAISGTVGEPIAGQDVVITLVNDEFTSLPKLGDSVEEFFHSDLKNTNLTAKLKSISSDRKVLTATISGSANAEVNKAMEIVIPAARLKSGKELKVTPNPKAVYQIFASIPYDVSVLNDGNGTASANPVKAPAGTEITLTATPKSGYKLKEWQVMLSGVTIGADNKFTMPNEDVEVKAIFEANQTTKPSAAAHSIAVTNDDRGKASANVKSAKAGDTITLTATPNSGYKLKEWKVTGGNVSIQNNQFTMPDSDVKIKAIFESSATNTPVLSHSITVTATNGSAGASKKSSKAGGVVTLTATPNSGYHFKGWKVTSGGVNIKDNRFTMPNNDVVIEAIFEADAPASSAVARSITVITDGHGTASASKKSAKAGETITLTATPNAGYRFKEWRVTSGGATVQNYQFTMPDRSVAFLAVFEKN